MSLIAERFYRAPQDESLILPLMGCDEHTTEVIRSVPWWATPLIRWGRSGMKEFQAEAAAKKSHDTAIKEFELIAGDGARIRAASIAPYAHKKWIVFLSGTSMCYQENLEHLKTLATTTGANVLTVTFRDFANEKGVLTHPRGYFLDALAAVQHLKKQGVLNEDIVCHGTSVAGAIAAAVAATYRGMHLCCDRSPSTLNALKVAYKDPSIIKVEGCFAKLAKRFFAWVLGAAEKHKLSLDVTSLFKEATGHKSVISSSGDTLIPESASLAKALEDTQHAGTAIEIRLDRSQFQKMGDSEWASLCHSWSLTDTQFAFEDYRKFIETALDIKTAEA